ncbi:hypothetical protein L3Y34_002717 [Caenorhabditis briggsae]|uniref:Uncharacterized protein n=1 Tax=Caenorhabditis briggsae TaxID=6238 RepID=A0AAE9DGP9_CAEBR|nr:hypothetical protein L3Y34_002717 [Caenorhabditis briggsae]
MFYGEGREKGVESNLCRAKIWKIDNPGIEWDRGDGSGQQIGTDRKINLLIGTWDAEGDVVDKEAKGRTVRDHGGFVGFDGCSERDRKDNK